MADHPNPDERTADRTTGSGARALATIMFTDTVGFSRIAAKNEAKALQLLNRDLEVIRTCCARHSGNVLNVMGDGLLLTFPSAVEGMECALDVQREIFARSLTLQKDDVLQHRIGIHLGDIVFEGDSVLGDGVNVASRLQTEARPGAICFSRTVNDVIQNKVKVKANYLGPRALKNIPDRVMVWEVPPLGEGLGPAPSLFTELTPTAEPGASGAKGAVMVAVSGVMLVLMAMGAIFIVPKIAKLPPTLPPSNDHGQRKLPQGLVHHKQPDDKKTDDKKADDKKADPGDSVLSDELRTQLMKLHDQYDFDGLVAALNADPYGKSAQGQDLITRYQDLGTFKKWLEEQLAACTPDHPLSASVDIGGGPVAASIYAAPAGGGQSNSGPGSIIVDMSGQQTPKQLTDLPPASILNLAMAAGESPQAPSKTPTWIQLFSQEYGLQSDQPAHP